METAENKYITVAYKLYTMEDGEKELFEEVYGWIIVANSTVK